jgi:hypothetical protein
LPLPGLSTRFVQVHRNHRNRSLPGNRIRGATREQQAAPLHTDAPVCARLAGEARPVPESRPVALRWDATPPGCRNMVLPNLGHGVNHAIAGSGTPGHVRKGGFSTANSYTTDSGFRVSGVRSRSTLHSHLPRSCSPARLFAFSPRFLDVSPNLCHTRYTNAITWGPPMCATLSSYTCAACGRGMTGRHDPLPVGPVATVC